MEPRMLIVILLALVLCVVVGVVYYKLVTKERSGQKHAGSVNAKPGDTTPTGDRGANAACLRRLRNAVARRGLALVQPDPGKSPFLGLIVGPHGVTAVYAVDYDGTIYGGPDEQWVQMKDGIRRTFENPLRTAETARRALRETINTGRFRPFMVDVKVVLTAPKAELAIPRNTSYYTPKTLAAYVMDSPELANDRKVDEEKVKAFLQQQYC